MPSASLRRWCCFLLATLTLGAIVWNSAGRCGVGNGAAFLRDFGALDAAGEKDAELRRTIERLEAEEARLDAEIATWKGSIAPQATVAETAPPRQRRMWHCERSHFDRSEDALVQELVAAGVLVPLRQGSEPVASSMANLHAGLISPAREPPLLPLRAAEVQLIGDKSAECRRRSAELKKRFHFCTIVRNREKLLLEWIQYHRLLGGEFFHIIDDDSEDGMRQALGPFTDANVVYVDERPRAPFTFFGQPVPGVQFPAIEKCFHRARKAMADDGPSPHPIWLVLIDSDEFILTDDCLADVVSRVEKLVASGGRGEVGAVVLPWAMVYHDGQLVDRNRTVFEATSFSSGELDEHFKSIVRADFIMPFRRVPLSPHGFELRSSAQSFFQDGTPSGNILDVPALLRHRNGHATLLHYHTRSLTSKLQRAADGRAGHSARPAEFKSLQNLVDDWSAVRGIGHHDRIDSSVFLQRHEWLLQGLGHQNKLASALPLSRASSRAARNAIAELVNEKATLRELPFPLRAEVKWHLNECKRRNDPDWSAHSRVARWHAEQRAEQSGPFDIGY